MLALGGYRAEYLYIYNNFGVVVCEITDKSISSLVIPFNMILKFAFPNRERIMIGSK